MSDFEKKYPFLAEDYSQIPIDSEDRPIKIQRTTKAVVPFPSEKYVKHLIDDVEYLNGNSGHQHRVFIDQGVMGALIREDERVAVVKNFRHPHSRFSVELPAGGVDEGVESLLAIMSRVEAEQLIEIARSEEKSILDLLGADQIEEVLMEAFDRETREEVGHKANNIKRLDPNPVRLGVGHSNQAIHLFMAECGQRVGVKRDNGEQGMQTSGFVEIDDLITMVEKDWIIEATTKYAVSCLANMYGKSVPWLPKPPGR